MLMTTTIHEEISQRVIEAIEHGQIPPWRRPISDLENDGFPTRPATLKPFKGVNVLILNMEAMEKGYRSKFWGSEQEWTHLHCTVSGRATVLPDGMPVFNGDQTNSFAHRSRPRRTPIKVDYSSAEAVIKASGADIRYQHGLEAAYYYADDYIVFPHFWQFVEGPGGINAYYDSLFHELSGHWSETRLGWDCPNSYVNELRSEMAAPFTTAQLGLPVFADMTKLPNHNKHLALWVRAIKEDPTLIFKVAADASQAVAYLFSLRG